MPGAGLVGQTMQFHGTADRYTAGAGTDLIATLFSTASATTSQPAVTLRSVGSNGGQAAAFAYDLARSVVYTRQGNPAWAGESRDGQAGPIRSDNLFFPDWVDFSKVQIPQADEQQRLLANLIEEMNRDQMPLPRFWYLPRDEKAVVVMTGDDHASNGTTQPVRLFHRPEPARMLGRRVGVRARYVIHLPRHADHQRPGSRVRGPGIRDRAPRQHELRQLDVAGAPGGLLLEPARRLRREVHERSRPVDEPDPLHRLERLGDAAKGRARPRHPPRHQLLLLAGRMDPEPARPCSPVPACRCASPTWMAR